MQCTSLWVTLCTFSLGACQVVSIYRSTVKEGWQGWVLRRISIVLHGNCIRGGHYLKVPSQCWSNSYNMEVEKPIPLGVEGRYQWGWRILLRVRRPFHWQIILIRILGLSVLNFISFSKHPHHSFLFNVLTLTVDSM